jgi:hypothetical protein
MTTSGGARAPTALDLLFESAEAPEALAGEILAVGGDQTLGLGNLPPAVRATAVREAAKVAAGLLQVDLIEVLVRGWREYRDIVAAARRTLAAPGSTELVSMVTHQVTVAQHPSVSVLVDSRRVATLQLDLSLVFDVRALLAGISGGRLVALHSGRCDVTVALAVQGTELLARRARLELPGVVAAGQGIRLLPSGEYPAGGAPASAAPVGAAPAGAYAGSRYPAGAYTGSESPSGRADPPAASTPWWESAGRASPPGRRS